MNSPAVSPPVKLTFWSYLSILIPFSPICVLRIENMNENSICFLIGDLSSDTLFKNPTFFTDWLESRLLRRRTVMANTIYLAIFHILFCCFLVWKWDIGTFSVRNPQNSRYRFKSKPVYCITTTFLYSF